MKSITVCYGSDSRPVAVDDNATVGAIVKDTTTKIVLGYGDNIKALVGGMEQSMDSVPADGARLVLETKANSKAIEG